MLEQAEHLGLTGGEVRMRRPRRSLVHVRNLPEDADDPVALAKRHGAQLDPDALTVGAHDDDLRVLRPAGAGDVLREDLSRPSGLLGRDDGGELPPAYVADEPFRRRVEPADDPGPVDDVARDVDRLQGALDVAADRAEMLHEPILAPLERPSLIPQG